MKLLLLAALLAAAPARSFEWPSVFRKSKGDKLAVPRTETAEEEARRKLLEHGRRQLCAERLAAEPPAEPALGKMVGEFAPEAWNAARRDTRRQSDAEIAARNAEALKLYVQDVELYQNCLLDAGKDEDAKRYDAVLAQARAKLREAQGVSSRVPMRG